MVGRTSTEAFFAFCGRSNILGSFLRLRKSDNYLKCYYNGLSHDLIFLTSDKSRNVRAKQTTNKWTRNESSSSLNKGKKLKRHLIKLLMTGHFRWVSGKTNNNLTNLLSNSFIAVILQKFVKNVVSSRSVARHSSHFHFADKQPPLLLMLP